MKIKKQTLSKLFGFAGKNTITEWSKDGSNRKSLKLIEKYFNENDIVEFMENGIVSKFENTEQAITLQKKIFNDVVNLVRKKQRLNVEDPEKKVFFTFGKFLDDLSDKNKTWMKSLKFEDYLKFEENIDDFFKKKYIQFLESQELNTLEIHNHLTVMEYIHFRTSNHYKFYFLKYSMWLLIPTKMEEIELEKVSKYQEIPEYIRKIPGTKKISNFITIMSHSSEVIYGK